MAQTGLHGIVALAAGRGLRTAGPAKFGLVLGSILPDLDMAPAVIAYVLKLEIWQPLRLSHRTLTHSFVTVAVLLLLSYLLPIRPSWRQFLAGFAVGVALHIGLDLFCWFDDITLLWPFAGPVNLWVGVHPPERLLMLLNSAEWLCYGLYYLWLYRMARQQGTDREFQHPLSFLVTFQFLLLPCSLLLSFALPRRAFEILHYSAVGAVFYPLSILVTVRLRGTIAGP